MISRELTAVTLINSGDFKYAKMEIRGNTIISAQNNSGKSTLLRCAVFGQTGNALALGFSANESISYYFSRRGVPGFLIFDYMESDSETKSELRKYSLLCMAPATSASREYHFIDAEFDTDWLLDENGNMLNRWGPIGQNLAERGITSTITARGDHEIRRILNGDWADKRALRYSMFSGGRQGNKKTSSAAYAIESIFRNGSLDQSSMKNMFLDKVRLRPENTDMITEFPIKELRESVSTFRSRYNDYILYHDGELDDALAKTIKAYEENLQAIENMAIAPCRIKKTRMMHVERQGTLSKLQEELKTKVPESKSQLGTETEKVDEARSKRKTEIDILSSLISNTEEERRRFTDDEWNVALSWIKEYVDKDGLKTYPVLINSKKGELETLRAPYDEKNNIFKTKEEEANKSHGEQVGNIEQEIEQIKVDWNNDERVSQDFVDEKLLALDKEKESEIETRRAPLDIEHNRIEDSIHMLRAELSLLEKIGSLDAGHMAASMMNDTASLSAFRKEDIVSLIRTILCNVKGLLFTYENKDGYHKAIEEKINDRNRIDNLIEQVIAEVNKEYLTKKDAVYAARSEINNEYIEKIKKLKGKITKCDKELKKRLSSISKQRDIALKNVGFDTEKEKRLESDIKELSKKYDYLVNNVGTINNNFNLLNRLKKLEEKKEELERLKTENTKLTGIESERLGELEGVYKKAEAELKKVTGEISNIESDIDSFEDEFRNFCLENGFEIEDMENKITNASEERINKEECTTLCDALTFWKNAMYTNSAQCLIMMRNEMDLRNKLSKEDNFGFSFGPNDTFSTNEDYIRVASNIRIKVKSRESSPEQHCLSWSKEWSHLLRSIVSLYRHGHIVDKIEREIVDLQRFINSHNTTHSIEDIRFEVVDEPTIDILCTAKRIDEFCRDNECDPFTVDISESDDGDLFTEKILQEGARRTLIGLISQFADELAEYKSDNARLEDYFKIAISASEVESGKVYKNMYNINDIASKGTTMTFKMLLAMCFVGDVIGTSRDINNRYTLVMDESGMIDHKNSKAIMSIADSLGFKFLTAQPDATVLGFNIFHLSAGKDKRLIQSVSQKKI